MGIRRWLIIVGRFVFYTLLPFCLMLIPIPGTRTNVLRELRDPIFWKMLYAPILGFGLLIAVLDLT